MLKREGIPKWVFEELKLISEFQFNYKSKIDSLSSSLSLTESMSVFPVEYASKVNDLIEEYRPEIYRDILKSLVSGNMILLVSSGSFTDLSENEPIYGTNYSFDYMPENLIKAYTNPKLRVEDAMQLHLPPKNYFIPQKFELKNKAETSAKLPVKIYSDIDGDLFYKFDDTFNLPKVNVEYLLYTHIPSMQKDPQLHLCFDIWNKILYNHLREYIYLAQTARFDFYIIPVYKGLKIEVKGYNDRMEMFLEERAKRTSSFMKLMDDPAYSEYLKKQFEMAL